MKKVLSFFIAAIAVVAVSCQKNDNKGNSDIDWSKVTVDGFYVAGPATGSEEIRPECVMVAGVNEAAEGKPVRDGMYEKYIVLDGGKEFFLLYNDGGKKVRYSAALELFKTPEEEAMVDGIINALTTPNTSFNRMMFPSFFTRILYHSSPSGASCFSGSPLSFFSPWGFTKAEASSFTNDGVTFTLKDQELAKNGEFKFATGNYWKVTLDDAGKVKAETSLGETGKGLGLAADNNIKVEKGGLYDITLSFKLAQGDFSKSFTYDVKLTKESTAPETMFMNGGQWGGTSWDWNAETIVELVPVYGAPGYFWCTRWFDHTQPFKFCAKREWNGDFTGSGKVGYTIADGNCVVAADGFYTVLVNGNDNEVEITPAVVVGMGDAVFKGGWDYDSAEQFKADGKKMVLTTSGAGELRLASKVVPSAAIEGVTTPNGWIDWWKTEFIFFEDGKIAYRGAGGDQARRNVEAGKKITIDFNAGTATIE